MNQFFKLKSFWFEGSYKLAENFLKRQMGRMEYEFNKLRTKQLFFKALKPIFRNQSVQSAETNRHETSRIEEVKGDEEMVFEERPETKQSSSMTSSAPDYDTLRCNILFTGMRLTKYRIEWPNQQDVGAFTLKLNEVPSERVLTAEFEIAAEHLKIAVNFLTPTRFESFVFLQTLSATDLENSSYAFTTLLEQSRRASPETSPKHRSQWYDTRQSQLLIKPLPKHQSY